MKKILFSITIFTLLLVAASSSAAALQKYYLVGHYTVTLPDGWVEIPKEVMQETTEAVLSRVDPAIAETIHYELAFQRESESDFSYPYMLVQRHEIPVPEGKDAPAFFAEDFEIVAETTESLALTGEPLSTPTVDLSRNMLLYTVDSEIPGVGSTRNLIALVPGSQRTTQLNFYALTSEYPQHVADFQSVIDSFIYEEGYQYSDVVSVNDKSTSTIEIVGIVGVVIVGLGAFWMFKSKKEEDDGSDNDD